MSSKTLTISRLARHPRFSSSDELVFEKGVNLLLGDKDAGKTKWLQMLDFLLGDTSKPQDAFGDELAQKYTSIKAEISIGEERSTVTRVV